MQSLSLVTGVGLPTTARSLRAKLFASFNHRFGSFRDVPSRSRFGKKAQPERSSLGQLANPNYRPMPRFWLRSEDHRELRLKARTKNGWILAFRHVCRAIVDARTAQACIAPCDTFSDSCAFVLFDNDREGSALSAAVVCGALTSFVGDYVLRQKIYGPALTKAILLQLPTPSMAEVEAWPGLGDGRRFILNRILELSYTAWDMVAFAADCNYDGAPFRWDEARRFLLRCELDAGFFHLYGIARDDADHIMETFPIVKRKDEAALGDYRTKLQILDIYDAMQRASTRRAIPDPARPGTCRPLGGPSGEHSSQVGRERTLEPWPRPTFPRTVPSLLSPSRSAKPVCLTTSGQRCGAPGG